MEKIGIVVAMEKELMPFLELCGKYEKKVVAGNAVYTFTQYPSLVALQCGVGTIQAAIGTTILIREYGVDRILNYGFVGYYDTDLQVGDIVNVEAVVDCDMDLVIAGNKPGQYDDFEDASFALDYVYFANATAKIRRLSSSDKFLEAGEELDKVISTFGKNLADMEGAGIAVACHKCGVPCSIVKCVSNTLSEKYEDYYAFSKHGIVDCAKLVFDTILGK